MLKLVFRNLGLLLGGKAVAGVISLIYLVIVTRALGPREFGVLVLVNGYVVAVGGIVAFSGWHTVVRYGAQALAAADNGRLVRLLRFMLLIELGCAALAIVVAVAGVPFAAARFGWPPEIAGVARWYALAVLANVVTTPYGILQLAGRFDLLGLQPALSPLIRLAGTLAVWFGGGGLRGYLIVWLISSVCEGLFVWLLAVPVFRTMRGAEPGWGPVRGVTRENPGLTRFLLVTNADLTLRDLAPKLVPLIVGAMLGPAAAGIYALAQRAAVVLQQPALQLSQAGYPVIARLIAEGARGPARRLTWRTSGIALAATSPLVGLFALFARQILALLGGTGFEAGATLLVLLAVGRAAQLGAVPFSSALIAFGHTGRSVAVNLATNVGLLPLLALLLWRFGLDGAGWHGLVLGVSTLIVLALVFGIGKDDTIPVTPDAEQVASTTPRQEHPDG